MVSRRNVDLQICIVGVGLCGAACVVALGREFLAFQRRYGSGWQHRVSLALIDNHPVLGPGAVYSKEETEPEHLLIAPLFAHPSLGTWWSVKTWYNLNRERVERHIQSMFYARRTAELARRFRVRSDERIDIRKLSPADAAEYRRMCRLHARRWRSHRARFLSRDDYDQTSCRAVYGLYIADQLSQAISQLSALGILVKRYPGTEVERFCPAPRPTAGYELNCRTVRGPGPPRRFTLRAVILVITTGHWQQSSTDTSTVPDDRGLWPTAAVYKKMLKSIESRVRPLAWSVPRECNIRITVRGASLTAHDIAKTIHQGGALIKDPNGTISFMPEPLFFRVGELLWKANLRTTLTSRRCTTPRIRTHYYPPRPDFVARFYNYANGSVVTLSGILSIIRAEYDQLREAVGYLPSTTLRKLLRPTEEPFQTLKRELASRASGSSSDESVILMRSIQLPLELKEKLFNRLNRRDKQRFLRVYKSLYLALDQPFTIEGAQDLLALHDAGVLRFARAKAPLLTDDVAPQKVLNMEWTVDAVGQGTNILEHPSPAIKSLLAEGLIEVDSTDVGKVADRFRFPPYQHLRAKRTVTFEAIGGKNIYLSNSAIGGFRFLSAQGAVVEGDRIATQVCVGLARLLTRN